MATIGEAVFQAIAGRGAGPDVASVPGAIGVFVAETGSLAAASRELGIPASTLRGWRAGRTPRGGAGEFLVSTARSLARAARLDPDREARMRADWSLDTLRVTATYNYRGGGVMKGGTDRELDLGPYMADIGEALVDAYLDGADADQLGELFASGIGDNGWYAQTFREESDGQWDVHHFDGWGD